MPTGVFERKKDFRGSPSERFFLKIKKTKKCWFWIGARNPDGYGTLRIERKSIKVHRFSYEIHKGKIPLGLEVCHSCDNTSCVNPEHLFLGTHSDNMRDMENKKRSKHPRGENQRFHKLTWENVIKIRRKYKTGKITQKRLSEIFGVGESTIQGIIKKQTWKRK